jgi:TolA-binding protein
MKPDPDLAAQVTELTKQVVETRNQMIKTANLFGSLVAEIHQIGRTQQQERRLLTLNSAVAYALFVVLISTGFYFTYRSQVERLDFEKGTLTRDHAALQSRVDSLLKAAENRREAEKSTAAFYRLIQSGQVQQGLKRYTDIAQLPLTAVEAAVFSDWVNRTQGKIAYASYMAAMKAISDKHFKNAVTEFQRSLSYLPHPPHEATLRYYLGISHMKLGNYQEASTELELALAADAEKQVSREIRFHLGTIYESLGNFRKAKVTFKDYIRLFPASPLAKQAQRRLKTLE